jgi:hypothetical protein
MGYLVVAIIWAIIWGVVVNQVIKNKGYEENWFLWGFFFSIFALIVALTKPDRNIMKAVVEPTLQAEKSKKKEVLVNGIFADKVDICSPLHIVSWDIQKENDTALVLYIKFCNVSESTVSAVLFSVFGFNSFGDKVSVDGEDAFDVIGQDLSVKPGQFGNVQMMLPDARIRKIDVRVKKVCFSDGTIEESSASKWIDTNQRPLSPEHSDYVKKENPEGKFHAIIESDYWQCVCGFVNTGDICRSCQMEKKAASEFTEANMENTYRKFIEESIERERLEEHERKKRAEETAEEAKLLQKRKKKYAGFCAVVGCAAVIFISAYFIHNHMVEQKYYEEESSVISRYLESAEYDDAFGVMISSDIYNKLKEEYGETLWKQQEELDQELKERGLLSTWNKKELLL